MVSQQTIEKMKERYTELWDRMKKAQNFLDDLNVPMHRKEKWLPKYREIIREAYAVLKFLQDNNVEMTEREKYNGFGR